MNVKGVKRSVEMADARPVTAVPEGAPFIHHWAVPEPTLGL
jgi:hypothetical protein